MNRIAAMFQQLKQKKESALIPYITAGYPTLKRSMRYIELFAKNGADMIEIGIPFSDPIADGRTIQYASNIALKKGVNLHDILREVARLQVQIPLIIMSYLNPILAFGIENFFQKISKAKVSGVIIPDLVIEEIGLLKPAAQKNSVDIIQMITPTSSDERIRVIAQNSGSFVYCVSVTGTTGMRKRLPAELPEFIRRARHLTDKPLILGFGISRTDQVHELSSFVDGVVIGSRIIEAIRKGEELKRLIREFKGATKNKL